MYRLPPPSPFDLRTAGMAGHCCESCAHGGSCDGNKGLGLFDSGMDFTQWGIPEWSIAGLGAYMVFSTVFTTQRGVRRVGRLPEDARRGVKRARKRLAKGIAGS